MRIRGITQIIFILAVSCKLMADSCFAQEIKKADLAGSWYSADKEELTATLEGFMAKADVPVIEGHILGLISPHAGYVFSGPTAAFGFKAVKDKDYKTVVIMGFTHRKFYKGIAVYDRGVFQTPLGIAVIDADFAKQLIKQDENISFYPDLFKDENSIEMIIPFVQMALKDAKIVPVAFGPQEYNFCEILAKALTAIIKDREDVLIIASSDMSHFHPYDYANNMDNYTIRLINKFDPKGLYNASRIGSSELCGIAPVVTLLLTAQMLDAGNVKILKYENSGDVTGDKRQVVGYVSAIFYKLNTQYPILNTKQEMEVGMLTEKQKKRLLEIARTTVEEYVKTGKVLEVEETDPELLKEKGAFVTLHYKGDLRGCIGNIIGRGPLYKTVRDMAIESCAHDPRFSPVSARELKDIKVEISVLSVPERVTDVNKLQMGVHGVIVKRGFNSGVFLPQVATETGWGRDEFLSNLCAHKAGLAPNAWKDPKTELYNFTAEVFGEE
jgi:MEMO1 family protein